MIMRLSLMTEAFVWAAAVFFPTTTQADDSNLKTYITVSSPVQVPGATLQPDVKYVFRRVDSGTE